MTQKTCCNYRQRDKQTEFIKRVKSKHISLRTKLMITYNWGKMKAIAPALFCYTSKYAGCFWGVYMIIQYFWGVEDQKKFVIDN